MSSLGKSVVLLVVIMLIGGGLVFWKEKYGPKTHGGGSAFNKMTKEEMELLFKDAPPMALKRLAEDPEMKKQQIDNLKELLATATAAKNDPTFFDENTKKATEIIEAVTWARLYDQEINKDKGPMPPFGFITEDQVKAFYGEGDATTPEQKANAKAFDEFLEVQLNFAKKNKAVADDQQPTDEEKKELQSQFAKIKIYEKEAKDKVAAGQMAPDFVSKVELQSKLQQAQFLSRSYTTDVLAKKAEVTDDDITKYLAEHPELNTTETKKAKANEVLARLKNGEDFGALAKEFSDDPGSKDKGGLYENVTEGGGFDKEFETAALALQPGQFTQEPVATQFGYHIIKLEKKGETKDAQGQTKQTYDVRHILFSTMIKDPENPMGRDLPAKDFVRQKLETEKQKQMMDKLIADNNVEIAEDFVIPTPTQEQLDEANKKMMQQMKPQGPDGPGGPDGPAAKPEKPAANKPAPKKK